MRFGVLGPVRVGDDLQGTVGGLRLRALLTLLLLDAGRIVPTDRLIDGVYAEDPPRGAANALQSQVSRLRQMLPTDSAGAPLVEFHPGGYRIAVDPDDVDVHRFARLAGEGQGAAQANDPRRAALLLRQALDQWRGPALSDVAELPFAGPQAARLEEQRGKVIEELAATQLALGLANDAADGLRPHADANPLRERTWALLIRALGGAGRQAEALAAFDRVRTALADELGADPSPELADAHLAVLRGETTVAPAAPERWGLRHQFTSFVGRENDVQRVASLFDDRQLVTLVGPGGAGKTRLAIEVADGYVGDVGFVDLSSLGETSDIPQVILGTLELGEAGLRASTSAPPTEDHALRRLENALANRALLLVLDNCEHVIAPVAALVSRLLSASPSLRVLATSREPLGITGEALHRLWGLPLPPGDVPPDPDQLQESAAVRLFVERGKDTDPGFALSSETVESVLRVCRRLDGLPLGIELAAARLRTLPVAEIARRLDDRFQLLSRGSRTAQPRHQTLRAVVEWSWDLLSAEEQRLARRFTVFSGGADLQAVEAVCGGEGTDVLETLSGLIDKSLVESDGGRYRMLDTVHAFCSERLEESGEAEAVREEHWTFFRDLAQRAEPWLRRTEQLEWLARLDAERDNLHLAIRRAVAAGDSVTAARMVAPLSLYWWVRGMRWEASSIADDVLSVFGDEPPDELYEEWCACVLLASITRTDPELVELREALRFKTWRWLLETEEAPRYPFTLYLFALASGPPQDPIEEDVYLTAVAGERHGPWLRSLTLVGSSTLARLNGERLSSEAPLRESLAGFRKLGDRWGMTLAYTILGEELGDEGRPAEGVAALEQALLLAHELQANRDIADLTRVRGSLRLEMGDIVAARADFEEAATLARRAGDQENASGAGLGLAKVALREGNSTKARHLAETALAQCPTGWFMADETHDEITAFLDTLGAAPDQRG
ncbi:winged helix-turn-helix domain-containing protein [Spiractinospora alimapuensis]|uniref:BTAD domain-containing putative transcriptional regulator n=1 Tax=Spiractinospora alimapuensis TaxID=2820884 RepID=UPI001F182071|nr:BTAD domain-containing putative transcriptional regulator [Spiractinospora alimapuensis]QVQ50161.1 winged helix-turn-helix domain-containing protein [Spiractinospora alimapuensis]